MANTFTLPVTSPASQAAGRRTRGAALPGAENVPQARQVSDPGLPALSAPAAAFGGPAVAGAEDLGLSMANVGFRIQQRQEGLDRGKKDAAWVEQSGKIISDIEEAAAWSEPGVIEQAQRDLEALRGELIASHDGSASSRAMLEEQLLRREADLTNRMAVRRISAEREEQDTNIEAATSGIVAETLQNPELPLEFQFEKIDRAIEFHGLQGSRADSARRVAQETVGLALVGKVIGQGEMDDNGIMIDARETLDDLKGVISSTNQIALTERIMTIENGVQQAGLELNAQVAALESLGERWGLSPDQTRSLVLGSLGIGGGSQGTEKERAVGNLVNAGIIDPVTGQKMLAGAIRLMPLRDEFNNVTGGMWVDMTTQQGRAIGANAGMEAPTPSAGDELAAASEVPLIDRTLFDQASGPVAVTGAGPAILDTLQGVLGQAGVNVQSSEQAIIRQNFKNAVTDLADSLVPNNRFPTGQIELIRENADIELDVLGDRRSLLGSLVSLEKNIARKEANALRDSKDKKLPADVRAAQAENAAKFSNFRALLGVPEGLTAEDIEAIPEPEEGGVNQVIDMFKDLVSGAEEGAGEVPTLTTQEEVDALESGSRFIWGPTGQEFTKD